MSALFSPYDIRAGIGAGSINDKIYEEDKKDGEINTNFLDGLAYHLARKALDIAKAFDARVLVISGEFRQNQIINNALMEANTYRNRLSRKQAKLLALCEILNPILSAEESAIYSRHFIDLLSLFHIDETAFTQYMRKEMLYQDLFEI